MKPTKKCSHCKSPKNINHYSRSEFARKSGNGVCCKCVRAKNPSRTGGGRKGWAESMGGHFVAQKFLGPHYN